MEESRALTTVGDFDSLEELTQLSRCFLDGIHILLGCKGCEVHFLIFLGGGDIDDVGAVFLPSGMTLYFHEGGRHWSTSHVGTTDRHHTLRFFDGHWDWCGRTVSTRDLCGGEIFAAEITLVHVVDVASPSRSKGGRHMAGDEAVDNGDKSRFPYFIPILCFSSCSFFSQVSSSSRLVYFYIPHKMWTSYGKK